MGKFRFSLLTLMGLVAFAGMGLAAMINPSPLWASFLVTLKVGTLILAMVGAVFAGGRLRVFCIGFLLCSGSYLVLIHGPWFDKHIAPYLVTTRLLEYLEPKVISPSEQRHVFLRTPTGGQTSIGGPRLLQLVGHSFTTLLFGFIGGLLAQYVSTTRERKP